ncbi:hypothetical protein AALA73_10460, partial [Parasutterella excrementihominis]|uniref:hypothetical protein n=1 Tax=Parasutterella excrementihominis TaxID=487175 RepID=UPI00356D80B4
LIFIVTLFGSVLIIAYHPPFVQRFPMKEEKLLECSNYTLYKRLVPIRLKAIKFFFFFDFIFHKLKNFFFETTSE